VRAARGGYPCRHRGLTGSQGGSWAHGGTSRIARGDEGKIVRKSRCLLSSSPGGGVISSPTLADVDPRHVRQHKRDQDATELADVFADVLPEVCRAALPEILGWLWGLLGLRGRSVPTSKRSFAGVDQVTTVPIPRCPPAASRRPVPGKVEQVEFTFGQGRGDPPSSPAGQLVRPMASGASRLWMPSTSAR